MLLKSLNNNKYLPCISCKHFEISPWSENISFTFLNHSFLTIKMYRAIKKIVILFQIKEKYK